MPQVPLAFGDAQGVDEIDPVALHVFDQRLRTMTGDVVHHCEDAPVRLRGRSDVPRDGVPKVANRVARQARRESLQEHAGQAVLLHPSEVHVDRGGAIGRVERCRAPFRKCERSGAAVRIRELREIGPHVHTKRRLARRLSGAEPVLPPRELRPVVRTAEPSLVAEHQLARQGGGVDARSDGSCGGRLARRGAGRRCSDRRPTGRRREKGEADRDQLEGTRQVWRVDQDRPFSF